jgi:dephospho-CoA kinase
MPRGRPLRIGITGPIGCGKSTIAGWLGERRGVVVIDADRVARHVLDRGEPALATVAARFGDALVGPDGELDRAGLGRLVFADPAALADLEAIVHPAVRRRILADLARADSEDAAAVVIEAIKLVEGGLAAECDETWLVTCNPRVQRSRLTDRGASPEAIDQRIAAQGDLAARVAPAVTRIIDTAGSPRRTRRLVDAAFDQALGARGR